MVKECNYEIEKDIAVRYQIVFGCLEDTLKEKFFREDLTLEKTVKICVAHQVSKLNMTTMQQENVHKMRTSQTYKSRCTKPDTEKKEEPHI